MAKNLLRNIFFRNKLEPAQLEWKDFKFLTESGFKVLAVLSGIDSKDYGHIKKLHEKWGKYVEGMGEIVARETSKDGKVMIERLIELVNKDREEPYTEADVIELHQKPKSGIYLAAREVANYTIRRNPQKYSGYSEEEIEQVYLDELVKAANFGINEMTTDGLKYGRWEPRPNLKISREEIEKACRVSRGTSGGEPDYTRFKKPEKVEIFSGNYQLDIVRIIIRENWDVMLKQLKREAVEGDRAVTNTIAGFLNTVGEVINDDRRIDIGTNPTSIKKADYKEYGGIKWMNQNNAFNKSVSTSVETRFQALIEEASVKKDYEVDELLSSTAMKHIGIFYMEISDAVVSIENNRLFREENKIK